MLAKTSSVSFTLQQGGSVLLLVTLSPHQTRIYVYESILQLCHVSLKLDFHSVRRWSITSHNRVPHSLFFPPLSIKDRFKLTQVKVMSHLFHAVLSVRKETLQIIQPMCVQYNWCSLWPLRLHLCWKPMFLFFVFFFFLMLILLPINSVKWYSMKLITETLQMLALDLYVINTEILVAYFSFVSYNSVVHMSPNCKC